MTKRNRDGDRLRILADREVSKVADQLEEAIVGLELVNEEGEERSRPTERRGALGEEVQEAGTQRAAPALEVSLVLPP